MATVPAITFIPKTECIGNSLVTINTNYQNIKNSFTGVDTLIGNLNQSISQLNSFAASISSAQLAQAWVKFSPRRNTSNNEDVSFTNRYIFNSFNISSVVKEESGKYLINLTKPLNTDFIINGTTSPLDTGGTVTTNAGVINLSPDTPTLGTSCRIIVRNLLGAQIDPNIVMLTFFSN